MAVTFLIGGRAYPVNDASAQWLANHLRAWAHVDDQDHESGPEGADAVQLKRAELVAEAITDDDDEPIELGWYDAEKLADAVATRLEVSGNAGLEALYDAACRFADRPRGKGY
jgi:hypothetical protein